VRGTNFARRHNLPLDIEPESGKIKKDVFEAAG
jgi:hypothetical protein